MDDYDVYKIFLEIMFDTFTEDEMAYAHVIQKQAIEDGADY